MVDLHCRDFKPSATAAWLCAWWKTEEVLISFSPYKTGIGGFCSRIPREGRVCETQGLRFMPEAQLIQNVKKGDVEVED